MNVYIIIGIIVFVVISKRLFSVSDRKAEDRTPPIFDENKRKSVFEGIFGEIFKEEGTKNIVKNEVNFREENKASFDYNKKEKIIQETKKETKILEENNFNIKEAVIYSEILNNPFIDRK
jgi:hypothetical protein